MEIDEEKYISELKARFNDFSKITGIHVIGIIPKGRQKGLAHQLMKLLLNISIKNKSKYATLQASDMGRELYLKLGFKAQFVIKNYAFQKPI